MRSFTLVIFCVFLFSCTGISNYQTEKINIFDKYKQVTHEELLGYDKLSKSFKPDIIPFTYFFPKNYSYKTSLKQNGAISYVGLPSDIEEFIESDSREKLSSGIFAIMLSPNVAFMREQNKFSFDTNITDYEKIGYEDINFKRYDNKNAAVIEVRGKRNGIHFYTAYIDLCKTGNTLRASYYIPGPETDFDRDIWETFLIGLGK